MKRNLTSVLGLLLATTALTSRAEEKLPVLKVGDEVYRNVVITGTNATDLYFTHSGGIGNAKLKKLDPELQKHFHFDAAKAAAAEQKQREANTEFNQRLATNKEPVRPVEVSDLPTPIYDNGDVVAPKLYARSFRGQRAPAVVVDRWLTPAPEKKEFETKSVLLVFWFVSSGACRGAVPRLNELAERYRDRMLVVALSKETPEEIEQNAKLTIAFHAGTDVRARTMSAFEVTAVPHAVLIDPKGIVRFEGRLGYLDNEAVEHLLTRYSK